MRYVLLVCVLLAAPVRASDPGEPMDCSDWVLHEPGLSCSAWAPLPCDSDFCRGAGPGDVSVSSDYDRVGSLRAVDNAGNVYLVRRVDTTAFCGWYDQLRTEVWRFDGTSEVLVASITDRCVNPNGEFAELDIIRPGGQFSESNQLSETEQRGYLLFDDKAGRLLIPLRSQCRRGTSYGQCQGGYWIAAIDGFTTTFEILQTFTPTADQVSFRVPYMPEGFQNADWFNTYYGDLATVGDWSQAQPLQCAFPMTMPMTGDYITVNDPLPDPSPGTGRYYITSINYQGQIRYGRKNINGVLSGRDPGVLPPCN